MQVKVLKPDTTLFEGTASLVQLPGTKGSFELMEHHAPIIAALGMGEVRIVETSGEKKFPIRAGVVRSQQNEVLVLVQ